LLAERNFEVLGPRRFLQFVHQPFGARCAGAVEQLDELLRDGARPGYQAAMANVLRHRPDDGLGVDAVVRVKITIFADQRCQDDSIPHLTEPQAASALPGVGRELAKQPAMPVEYLMALIPAFAEVLRGIAREEPVMIPGAGDARGRKRNGNAC